MGSSNTTVFTLSKRLDNVLNNNGFSQAINFILSEYKSILTLEKQMFFFPEYTKHDIDHIKSVLNTMENLVPNKILSELSQETLSVIIASVVFHDIGMLIDENMFKSMVIDGEYDDVRVDFFDEKTWKQLWNEYLFDSNYWNAEIKTRIFGKGEYAIEKPNFSQSLNDFQKKFIGEFIRIHHGRIAHEVALKGYYGTNNYFIPKESDYSDYMDIVGVIARSHQINLRKTVDYLKKYGEDVWNKPFNIPVIYIMVLLRLADYLHMDKERSGLTSKQIEKLHSPFSRKEHETHLAIKTIHYLHDSEQIIVQAKAEDAKTYVKVEKMVENIQREFDTSWAVLGEVYHNEYTLNIRRIKLNFIKIKDLDYEPRQFRFHLNDEIAKLLIEPLYGDNPSFGVRELIQNSVDACRECMNDLSNNEKPCVKVELNTINKIFTITDTGKGMSLEEIEKYFLTIGSSYNDNIEWEKKRNNEHIYRTGRFGIGVLAAFLLGNEITVTTRSRKDDKDFGHHFKTSLIDTFIDIYKNKESDNIAYGTQIKIKCSNDIVGKLSEEAQNKLTIGDRWFGWYIEDNPKVSYYIDGKEIILNKSQLVFRSFEHPYKKNVIVRWIPRIIFKYSFFNPTLFCNGFFITSTSEKKHFSIPLVDLYYPFCLPTMHIIDDCNTLPLNLTRTNIKKNITFDFEKKLAKELCIDLLCQLMSLDINYIIDNGGVEYFYFSFSTFSFINEYTNKLLVNKICVSLYYHTKEELRILFEIVKNCFSDLDVEVYFSFSWTQGFGSDQISFIKDDLKSFKEYLKDKLFIKDSSFIERYQKELYYYFMEEIGVDAGNIKIGKIDYQRIDKEFHNLFDYYMQGDPIIPNDIDCRRKKFSLLFSQFSEQIDYYKNIYDN